MPRILAFLDPVFAPVDAYASNFTWDSAPMSGLAWPVGSAIVYVLCIFWLTPAAKDKKKQTEALRSKKGDLSQLPWRKLWTWPLVMHYTVLSLGSLVMLVGTLRELEKRWVVDSGAHVLSDAESGGLAAWTGRWLLCEYVTPGSIRAAAPYAGTVTDGAAAIASGPLYFWSYIYYLSKWYELLDTVLELQRGAPPPSFGLHVYHHATVMLMSWFWMQQRYSLQWIGLCFNTFVHVVMYMYYALSRAGQRVSWKTLVTGLQVVQFGTSLVSWVAFLALHLGQGLQGYTETVPAPGWAKGLGDAAAGSIEAVLGTGAAGHGTVPELAGGEPPVESFSWLAGAQGYCAGGWAVVFNLIFNVTLLHGFVGILAKAMCRGGVARKRSKPEPTESLQTNADLKKTE